MDVPCPNCDEALDPIDQAGEMGSGVRRFRCLWCELYFERDASGLVVEVEGREGQAARRPSA